ncbi:MAG: AAA family ATPase [Bacteroidales bacterium]
MNPFLLRGYKCPTYFCDRENETNKILTALKNSQDITLYGYRRLGKSALIKHVFYNLENEYNCIYVDIWGTTSIEDFSKTLINSTIQSKLLSKKKFTSKILDLLKSIGASFTICSDGKPSVDIIYKEKNAEFNSIEELFYFIKTLKTPVIMAIDEFQEIRNYDKHLLFEAKLRALTQSIDNVNFIFSGSEKHLLSDIFTSHKMPFYQSTRMLSIDKISKIKYSDFITRHFKSAEKTIDAEVLDFILNESYRHTYYTQAMLNLLFSIKKKTVLLSEFKQLFKDYILEKSVYYSELPDLLTKQQFMLLKAIGKKGIVKSPTSSGFLINSGIESSSSMHRLINSLLTKQILLKENNSYRLYDVFLEHYIKFEN